MRGPLGQVAGTYTTNACEIDQILIDAWKLVHEGNAKSHKKLVAEFIAKSLEYVYKRKAGKFKLKPICGADLKATCKEAKLSAAGLDQ